MACRRAGVTCPNDHFNYAFDVWEPFKDQDLDKLAERRPIAAECETCGSSIDDLPHVEGTERESPRTTRRGGRNIPAAMERQRAKDKPREGPLAPSEWKRRVFDRQREHPGGPALCAVTGEVLSFLADDGHHVLEKSLLRERGLHHLVWDERNGLAIKARIHGGHTTRLHPIPREALLPCNWEFARQIGPWAIARLEQAYPATKGSR